jgi:hypothetical protein
MITMKSLGIALAALTLAGAVFAFHAMRHGCPGKMTCPLTGKVICQDECPMGAKTAPAEAPKAP